MIQLLEGLAGFISDAPPPLLLLVKATLLLAAGALITAFLRGASAAARYAAWSLTIAAAVALPLGTIAAPAWRVAVATSPAATTSSPPVIEPLQISENERAAANAQLPAETIETARPRATAAAALESLRNTWPAWLWALGFIAVIGRMVAGRFWLARVTERSTALRDEWSSLLDAESSRLGLTKPVRLLASSEISTPLTVGITSPVILLPEECFEWSAELRQVVLRHELVHVAGRDTVVCVVAGVACALYWFHPLAWLATRRLRIEQERACDDRVLELGTPSTEYATHLLEVARSARNLGMRGFVSVAMARPSQLEGRLLSVLNDTRNRRQLTRRARLGWSGIALIVLGVVATLRPVIAESAIVVASQAVPSIAFPKPMVVVAEKISPAAVAEQAVDSVIVREAPASSGGTVVLDLRTGASLNIIPSDGNKVRMRASLAGRSWRETILTFEPNDRGVTIATRFDSRTRIQSTSHRIDLTVPRRFNVQIQSAGGGITIRDLEGRFTGATGGGDIRIENARGFADLSTGGGKINVSRSRLDGTVSTGGGGVLLQDVTGGLRGSSGSGEVYEGSGGFTFSEPSSSGVRAGSNGRLFSRKSGGNIIIPEAPNGASVSTGGGYIEIGPSRGEVSASTGGGAITIGPVRGGTVEAHTGAGDVEIDLRQWNGRPIEVTSGSGTVTLTLPSNVSADLDLETAYTNNRSRPTRIDSDWDLRRVETTDWDAREGTPRRYVRARQSIGEGGATIKVKTVNGNIVIKRGSSG